VRPAILPVTVIALKLPSDVILFSAAVPSVPLSIPALTVPGTSKLVVLIDSAVIVPVDDIEPGTARLPINALTVLNVFDVILPVTVSALKLPRLVILFNAAVPSVPLSIPALTMPGTSRFVVDIDNAVIVPVDDIEPGTTRLPMSAFTVLIEFDVILPLTVSALKLPSDVILFNAAVPSVPLSTPALTIPGTSKLVVLIDSAVIVPVDDMDPGTARFPINAFTVLNVFDVILPVTVSALKLPSDVILFNAAVPSVPLSIPALTMPGTFKLVVDIDSAVIVPVDDIDPGTTRLPIKAFTVLIELDVILPVTVTLVNPPSVVIFG